MLAIGLMNKLSNNWMRNVCCLLIIDFATGQHAPTHEGHDWLFLESSAH